MLMMTSSLTVGTLAELHVLAVFQLPVATTEEMVVACKIELQKAKEKKKASVRCFIEMLNRIMGI